MTEIFNKGFALPAKPPKSRKILTKEQKVKGTVRFAGVYKCMICDRGFVNSRDRHLDHCHITGTVRGVLCSNCNKGLGCFRDELWSLHRAIKYLRASRR